MAVIILSALATVLLALWLFLLFQVTDEDWVRAASNKVLSNLDAIAALEKKDAENQEKLSQYHGVMAKVMGLIYGGNSQKQIKKLQETNVRLQQGDLRSVNLLVMPGYVAQRRVDALGKGQINKVIYARYVELSGKKYADNRTRQLLAQMCSYPIIGVALALALASIMLGTGNTRMGLLVGTVGVLLVLFLVYALYDEVADKVKKRRAAISRQFPNVVSKLALLVTSGMIMDRAWKEAAYSEDGELYLEMRKTSEERDNLVDPSVAYANFIDRCSTKEATKLASAIIQNQSKGNAEIGILLKDMAHEAWQERRHTAKRDSEAANSKLMIPTMMLFITILVMIMVPVAMSFSGF